MTLTAPQSPEKIAAADLLRQHPDLPTPAGVYFTDDLTLLSFDTAADQHAWADRLGVQVCSTGRSIYGTTSPDPDHLRIPEREWWRLAFADFAHDGVRMRLVRIEVSSPMGALLELAATFPRTVAPAAAGEGR